jgi:hypothetical protein
VGFEAGILIGYFNANPMATTAFAKHQGRNAFGCATDQRTPPHTLGLRAPTPAGLSREQHIARSSLKSRLTGPGSAERVMYTDPGRGGY